ncbi:hypothetical protein L2W58_01495 [Dethiosulfovibrio sp. F2B]|uniref:hypothetical protein n=1 Tax=Dethiosulfovibrio faecalis TaxID=2720018 RepID=UPI001F19940B|nr:hypothetical protein [Dethiosulfovibrio faecalis]MCF4150472.1 hypothetical protein [Dethiosulfovibrio faecalis]
MVKKICVLVVMLIFVSVGSLKAQEPIQPVKGDRMISERFFTDSYRKLIQRKYWSSLESIDDSLKADPYNVDCYLLRAIVERAMGLSERALGDLNSYLEVRPRDATAKGFFKGFSENDGDPFRRIPVKYQGYSQSLKTFFKLSPQVTTGTLGLAGIGFFGDSLAVCDRLSDRVRFFSSMESSELSFNSPVALVPLSLNRFVMASEKGTVVEYEKDEGLFNVVRSGDLEESLESVAFLSDTKMVAALPDARKVVLYDYPSLNRISEWSPPKGGLFEPRGLAVRGSSIAVSDRSGDKIFIFSWNDQSYVELAKEAPRSLIWGVGGDLLSLSDDGTMTVFSPEEDGSWHISDEIEIEEGFSMTRMKDQVYIVRADGRAITALLPVPSVKNGVTRDMILYEPLLEGINEDQGTAISVRMSINGPLISYTKDQSGVLSTVWQDTMKPGRILSIQDEVGSEAILVSGKNLRRTSDSRALVISQEDDSLERGLRMIWEEGLPVSQLILDSSIDLSKEQISRILRFCLMNGVSISAWSTKIPSDNLILAVENTGGTVYYSNSLSKENIFPLKTNSFFIKIFYPDTVYSSGYPSKNMLSTIADFGMISYRGWLPVWPDLL